jgi:hypothetical protein
MALTNYLPRTKSPSLSDAARERQTRQSLRLPAAPSPKDIEQDALIHALERETRELRIYVAALIRLLGRKEMIDPAEMDALVALADQVQRGIQLHDRRNHSKLRDLVQPTRTNSAA